MMQAALQIGTLLLKTLDTFIQQHPNLTLAILFGEVADSLIASELPMPDKDSSKWYHALFVVMTGLAINRARVAHAVAVLRGTKPIA